MRCFDENVQNLNSNIHGINFHDQHTNSEFEHQSINAKPHYITLT